MFIVAAGLVIILACVAWSEVRAVARGIAALFAVLFVLTLPVLYELDREWQTVAMGEVAWIGSSKSWSSTMTSTLTFEIDGVEFTFDCMVEGICGDENIAVIDYVWVGCRRPMRFPLTLKRSECRFEVIDRLPFEDDGTPTPLPNDYPAI